MAKEFDITDLDDLLKELDKKGKNIKIAINRGVTRTTYNCQAMAKDNAPVSEKNKKDKGTGGHLRESIHAKVKEKGETVTGTVEPTVEYAVYPEFGTGQRGMASQIERPEGVHYSADWKGQDAQPYMYPAYLYQRDKLLPNIKKQLEKELKGAN